MCVLVIPHSSVMHKCTTAANQVESEKIALYSSLSSEFNYESLTKFCKLRMSDFFYVVGESLLNDDK